MSHLKLEGLLLSNTYHGYNKESVSAAPTGGANHEINRRLVGQLQLAS